MVLQWGWGTWRARTRFPPLLLVLAAYAGLAVLITFPLCLHLGTVVPGIEKGDVWDHLWSMDWTRRALLDPDVLFFFTPAAYYPVGLELFPLNLLNELLSVPLQAVLGLVPAFNLLYLLHFVFAGWAAFQLVALVTGSRTGGFVGGCVYAFTPCVVSALINGTMETAASGWIPLFLWLLLRDAGRELNLRTVLPAALALFLTAVSSWYYGAFVILFAVGFLFAAPWLDPKLSGPRTAGRTAAILFVGGLLIVIPATILHATLSHPDARHMQEPGAYIDRALDNPTMSASPASFVQRPDPAPGEYRHVTFVGYTALVLAALGLAGGRGGVRRRLWWAGVTLAFAGMALGPVLWIRGGRTLFLPYYLAMEHLPLFHGLEFPYRFTVMVALGLAVLTGFGAARIAGALPRPARPVAAGAIGLLIVLEYAAAVGWPLPVAEAAIPAVYDWLARQPAPGAVLELPLGFDVKGRSFYHQLAHRRPIPSGINSVLPTEIEGILFPVPRRSILYWPLATITPAQVEALRQRGFAYVVWSPYRDRRHARLLADLPAAGAELVQRAGQIRVYALGPGPDAATP